MGGGIVPTGFYCSKKFSPPPSFGSRQHYHLHYPRFTFIFFILISSTYYQALPHSLRFSFDLFPFFSLLSAKNTEHYFLVAATSKAADYSVYDISPTSYPHISYRYVLRTHVFTFIFLFYFLVSPAEFIERLFFILPPSPFVCEPSYATGMNSTHTHTHILYGTRTVHNSHILLCY